MRIIVQWNPITLLDFNSTHEMPDADTAYSYNVNQVYGKMNECDRQMQNESRI